MKLKHTIYEYARHQELSPIWGEFENQYYSFRIIRVRKEHRCCNDLRGPDCMKVIPKDCVALFEKTVLDGETKGWVSCYTCVKCLDRWMEETSLKVRV